MVFVFCTVFLQVWGIFLRLGLVWCDSCLFADIASYVCKEIPTSYPPGLTSLVLWVSNLREINSAVFNYTNLASVSSLSMRNTGITAISPAAFDKFQSLKILDLYNNHISQVSSAWFTHKQVLEHLDLSNNSITVLNQEAFYGLSGLLRLNLSYNQIQIITTDTLHSLRNLRLLDLSNNKLTHLSVNSLPPVNRTKMCLSGNPWNCSDTEFTGYVRDLQRASLLENEMEVVCNSPACLRGVPVWNVSTCIEPGPPVDPTVGYNLTLPPTPQTEPQMNWSVVISLIVVLCALVLVICVLSVLYHRKRERKHLQTIRPSPEELEHGKQTRLVCRRAQENFESSIPDPKKKKTKYQNQVLLKLDRAVLENVPENVSQIFQIYGSRLYQSRETSNRPRSAGPVLSRTGNIGKHLQTEVEDQKDPAENIQKGGKLFKHGWVKIEKEQRETEKVEDEDNMLETREKFSENQVEEGVEEEEGTVTDHIVKEGTLKDFTLREGTLMESTLKVPEVPQRVISDTVEEANENLTSSFRRHDEPPQPGNDNVLPLEDSETLPYLTIGTNAENQNPKPEPIPTKTSPKLLSSKPIRRVLTWPPTAVQWKKQWTQNPQVLNAFPKLIYVAGCKHQIGTFPFSTSLAAPEHVPQLLQSSNVPQDGISGSLLAQCKTVEPLKQICESTIRSYIENLPNLTQHYAEVIEEVQSRIVNHNSLTNCDDPYSLYDLVQNSPRCEESNLKFERFRESVNSREDSESVKRNHKRKKVKETAMSQQTLSTSEKHSRRRDNKGKKLLREGQKDQIGSDSRALPSGGSPGDDNLLVDNEYAFIDLLHEVVENHGRWTRERWRQSHLNRQKQKQTGVGFQKRL
ncbi:hypothetical protein AMEX_G25417 [Astyanax mexicanus]|uniref:LRRCT domain-containing protein n=1 Tax=Astyanax mexicanus TaxID=7994 RepID=A0A8T2KVB6_ASTMX|nr:hypothetical protein AMEX_G25417 [Astyanax mexicanus]